MINPCAFLPYGVKTLQCFLLRNDLAAAAGALCLALSR